MKIMGIDYGRKYIGLAISDDERKMAFPYKTLENNSKFFSLLNEIIEKEEIYKIVIGLPVNKKMKPTQQTKETEKWAGKLVKKVAAPEGGEPRPDNSGREVIIDFENEIFTSKEAEKSGAKNVHSAAAALILQSYLDRS